MTPSLSGYMAATVLIGCLAACAGSASSRPVIRVDGSSTVYPISEAVAEEFLRAGHPEHVTVGISGTGGGFQKFCRGESDISDASRPISPTELAGCAAAGIGFIELPVAYDGIAIVVHPRATWINDITVAELRTLWAPEAQGRVTRWNHVRVTWPDREIHLYGAGVDSGTYDYFTEAITGKARSSRGDFTSSEDDNTLVQGVSGDENALGFVPFAYYEENRDKLKLVPVDDQHADNRDGAIAPSRDSIRAGQYQPLARPLFIYVSEQAVTRPDVTRFVEFFLAEGPALAEEVGYVRLDDRTHAMVRRHFNERRTGSVFAANPSQVGVTVEELLARQRAQ